MQLMSFRKARLLATAFLCLAVPLSACGTGAPSEDAPAQASGSLTIDDDIAAGKARLDRLMAPLITGDIGGETRALLVMHRGRIVAEYYAPGYNRDTRLLGWSMSKTVTAVLIGMLITDGRLELDAPVHIPAWSSPGDPRRAITLRHMLHMAAGLDHVEAVGPESKKAVYSGDTTRMLFLDGAGDMARYATGHMLTDPPGKRFNYSSATSVILSDIIARTLTPSTDPALRRDAVLTYARGRLFDPVGLGSMTPEFDAAGTMIGGSMIHATARDWAKFGEFLRNNGAVEGAQIIPGGWVRFMKEPSPANAAYGGHIWRNVPRTDGDPSPVLFPDLAPANVFALQGHYGQYVIVSPSQRLTVVRLGMTEGEDRPALTRQLGQIVAAFPGE